MFQIESNGGKRIFSNGKVGIRCDLRHASPVKLSALVSEFAKSHPEMIYACHGETRALRAIKTIQFIHKTNGRGIVWFRMA